MKQGLSYISFCPLRILYNSKFIIMITFLETNAVVVTRIHCSLNYLFQIMRVNCKKAHFCMIKLNDYLFRDSLR